MALGNVNLLLLTCSAYLTLNTDNKNNISIATEDFSKAFDKLLHNKLLCKLIKYGKVGKLRKWICLFLKGRTYNVNLNGIQSASFNVASSIP